MKCTLEYGLGINIKHAEELDVCDAFKRAREAGWSFYNIYYNDRLVYTTTGAAGYRFICEDCLYAGRR